MVVLGCCVLFAIADCSWIACLVVLRDLSLVCFS